jgi:hypothetical protein
MVGAVVGILVLLMIVPLLPLAPTRYIGPAEVGLVIKTLGYSNTSRSKTPYPTSQL